MKFQEDKKKDTQPYTALNYWQCMQTCNGMCSTWSNKGYTPRIWENNGEYRSCPLPVLLLWKQSPTRKVPQSTLTIIASKEQGEVSSSWPKIHSGHTFLQELRGRETVQRTLWQVLSRHEAALERLHPEGTISLWLDQPPKRTTSKGNRRNPCSVTLTRC